MCFDCVPFVLIYCVHDTEVEIPMLAYVLFLLISFQAVGTRQRQRQKQAVKTSQGAQKPGALKHLA